MCTHSLTKALNIVSVLSPSRTDVCRCSAYIKLYVRIDMSICVDIKLYLMNMHFLLGCMLEYWPSSKEEGMSQVPDDIDQEALDNIPLHYEDKRR